MQSAQERWDETFQQLGRSAPAQRADEATVDYLRRLSRVGRKYIPRGEQIASVRFDSSLPDNMVERYSELMRTAVKRNVHRSDNMQPGELRPIIRVDKNTGAKVREFIGPTSFVRDPQYGHRPARLVARINMHATTPLYDAHAAMRGIF
jgi:hypothetical protein